MRGLRVRAKICRFRASAPAKAKRDSQGRAGTSIGVVGFLLKLKRNRIDAITLPGWYWSIIEYMAEMSIAAPAQHFGTDHAKARIGVLADIRSGSWLPETWPARTRVVLVS